MIQLELIESLSQRVGGKTRTLQTNHQPPQVSWEPWDFNNSDGSELNGKVDSQSLEVSNQRMG